MAVYAKGDRFMASFGAGPTRIRKTFKTESEGIAWEAEQEALRASSVPSIEPVPTCWTLQKAFDHTLQHRWRGTGGERKARINAQFALDFFGSNTLLSEINAKWIIEYMEELMGEHENSPSTLNKKLSALKVMLTESLEIGGIDTVPRMKRYTEDTRSPHWYTDSDEKTMLDMCHRLDYPELAAFITIGLDTGFRSGEIMSLKMADYHKGNLLIHADNTKGKKARTVPASGRLKTLLAGRSGQHRVLALTKAELRKQWVELRGALQRNDDPFFIPHTMRHTCATRLVSEGVSLKAVQLWLGHGVIESTMVYAHLAPGQLESAGILLDARKPDVH